MKHLFSEEPTQLIRFTQKKHNFSEEIQVKDFDNFVAYILVKICLYGSGVGSSCPRDSPSHITDEAANSVISFHWPFAKWAFEKHGQTCIQMFTCTTEHLTSESSLVTRY